MSAPYAVRTPDVAHGDELWAFGFDGGVRAEVYAVGARLHALHVPDRDGVLADVVLAPADPGELSGRARYLGATVGRYGNRIGGGILPLDGEIHQLRTLPTGHSLHGGPEGFDLRKWSAQSAGGEDRTGVRLRLRSQDGDQGFPGTVDATVCYLLDRDGTLTIEYTAVADRPTVVNLTNHAYFNLAGEGAGTVDGHLLQCDADHYLPVDGDLIPLGPAERVRGTPFDLTSPRRIGEALAQDHRQLRLGGGGFDHNWVLRDDAAGPRRAAVLRDPASGRRMDVHTTEPGLQIYTGNHFDGSFAGKSGSRYPARAGVALETQHFPDSPNRPEYPSAVLRPGEVYHSTTVLRFTCEAATDGGPERDRERIASGSPLRTAPARSGGPGQPVDSTVVSVNNH
ncbi:aldose epimerase family protein [Streptomyces sp. Wb2n-11]|uniref:aldose epimerase family protein n=1 Tax=Streptomyces sp. Wb2n-11 TaxID=1030533 RepID=UPI000ACA9CF4|nr:aldose epimerase family protein [Streptomyces sp. Wb2n-11]